MIRTSAAPTAAPATMVIGGEFLRVGVADVEVAVGLGAGVIPGEVVAVGSSVDFRVAEGLFRAC